jgi:hypothetical protein
MSGSAYSWCDRERVRKESRMGTSPITSKLQSFFATRRMGLAALGAGACCAAWCAGPAVAAFVLGSGGAVAVTSILKPGLELGVGAIAFAAILGAMAVRARARKAGCETGCSAGDSFRTKLLSLPGTRGADIVCTADLRNAQAQIDEYRTAFAYLVSAERFPEGFRWRFRAEPGLVDRLARLAEREAQCCRFFSFELYEGSDLVWETRTEPRASAMLEEYFRLPERLRAEPRSGYDVAALERCARAAGLAFQSLSPQKVSE